MKFQIGFSKKETSALNQIAIVNQEHIKEENNILCLVMIGSLYDG